MVTVVVSIVPEAVKGSFCAAAPGGPTLNRSVVGDDGAVETARGDVRTQVCRGGPAEGRNLDHHIPVGINDLAQAAECIRKKYSQDRPYCASSRVPWLYRYCVAVFPAV